MSKTKNQMSTQQQIADLSNKSSRSMIAVIDTVASRGGFKGEELSTIGNLRDHCVQIISLCESQAAVDAADFDPT